MATILKEVLPQGLFMFSIPSTLTSAGNLGWCWLIEYSLEELRSSVLFFGDHLVNQAQELVAALNRIIPVET